MLSSYRRILRYPGTLLFSATGLVARLPIAMVSLGIVLLVSAATGSYGLAGSVSAVYLVANGCFAIVQGRLLDKYGQFIVLVVAAVVFGVSLAVVMWSVQADLHIFVTYAAAAVCGATLPTVGSAVRSRWSHVLDSPDELQTAFALEAVWDEAVFMLGPILVTVLATSWHPLAGLTAALVTGVVGTLLFAAQRSTEPSAQFGSDGSAERARMPWLAVVPLAIVCTALGTLFGAAEVSTVGFAEEHGDRGYTGFLLALWAAGSLIAGVITGAIHWRRGPEVRVRWGAAGMMAAMLPLSFIDSLPVMAVILFLAGFAIAPTLIATVAVTERTVPPSRLTEGMAVIHTGIVAGVAPGATLAGFVIDEYGASPAYLVALAAGTVAALASLALPRTSPATNQSVVEVRGAPATSLETPEP